MIILIEVNNEALYKIQRNYKTNKMNKIAEQIVNELRFVKYSQEENTFSCKNKLGSLTNFNEIEKVPKYEMVFER